MAVVSCLGQNAGMPNMTAAANMQWLVRLQLSPASNSSSWGASCLQALSSSPACVSGSAAHEGMLPDTAGLVVHDAKPPAPIKPGQWPVVGTA